MLTLPITNSALLISHSREEIGSTACRDTWPDSMRLPANADSVRGTVDLNRSSNSESPVLAVAPNL